MATRKQIAAASRKIDGAQAATKRKCTLRNLPAATRADLGRQSARAAARGGEAGHRLANRTRQQLYELAKERGVAGRPKMGKWELIEALRG